VTVGDTTDALLKAADSVRTWTFTADTGGEFAVFVQVENSSVNLLVTDSVNGQYLGAVAGVPSEVVPAGLYARRTERFVVAPGTVVRLAFTHWYPEANANIRFLVYPVNRAPEHRAANVAYDSVITGERLENSADVDEFLVNAQAGDEIIGFVKADSPSQQAALELLVYAPSGLVPIGRASDDSGQTDLEARTTWRLDIAKPGSIKLLLQHASPVVAAPFPGNPLYRFQLRRIDRGPEHTAAQVTPGDTISGETIDYVGDIDEFTIAGVPDGEVNLFLQATGATNKNAIFSDTARTGLGLDPPVIAVDSVGTTLLQHYTTRFRLDGSGHHRVTMTGAEFPLSKGPYRFFVYPINRAPEHAAAVLQLGDTIKGESIELPGDVDEFTVQVPANDTANFLFWRPNSFSDVLVATVDTGPTAAVVAAIQAPGLTLPEYGTGTGRRLVQAGDLALHIEGGGTGGGSFTGPYRVETFSLDDRPELASPTLILGDTITEAMEPAGDHDAFTFQTAPGQLVNFFLQGTGFVSGYGYEAALADSVGEAFDGLGNETGGTPGVETGRLDLPYAGRFEVLVSPNNEGQVGPEQGPYRLAVVPVDPSPEQSPAAFPLGDTLTAEGLDYLGDVDQFLVTAPVASSVQVLLSHSLNGILHYETRDPATMDLIQTGNSYSITGTALGPTALPAGGQFYVRVFQARSIFNPVGNAFSLTGPYTLAVVAIDSQPESVVSTIAVGDTVFGEAIDPIGDIDEFSFAGSVGQVVTAKIRAPFAFDFSTVRLDIVNASNGNILGSAQTIDDTVESTGPITLPVTGAYLLRVHGISDREGQGGYRITLE